MTRYADVALQAGRSAGEAARAQRDVWANFVSTAAQLPGQIYARRQQEQRLNAITALEQAREARARGEEERAVRLEAMAEQDKQAKSEIFRAGFSEDGSFDETKAVQKATELGQAHLVPFIHEQAQKLKPKLEQVKTRTPEGGETTQFIEPRADLTITSPPPVPAVGTIGQFLATKAKEKGGPLTSADIAAATKEYKTAEQVTPTITPYQEASLGAQGVTRAETARHNRAMEAAAPKPDDAEAIADAIISGDQPPVTTGLYRLAGPVRAALAKKDYDLTKANLDFQATQKYLQTLNGAQQTRMRQAVATASDSLGVIEDLAKQWDAGKFPLLNRAQLILAKNGVLGPQAQQIATNLEAQITDVVSELGNVYMGGNSPTDHALQLAGKNLSAEWTKDQLLSAIKLARTNLHIRGNSMTSLGAAGLSTGPATTPTTAKTVTLTELDAIAKRRGTTVDQERARFINAGYAVVK